MAILPDSIYSPDHLRVCVDELKAYAAALDERARGSRSPLPELTLEATDLMNEIKGADINRSDVVNALASELERHLGAAPSVSITLAASPSHRLKLDLVDWLRSNLVRELMVDFLVNPDIAGGMVVRTPNKLFDLSFRTKLLEKPERFIKVLERV